MSVDQRPEIENLLLEERMFPPDPAFAAQANATGGALREAAHDPEAFWARIARETVTWNEPFRQRWNGICPSRSGSSAAS